MVSYGLQFLSIMVYRRDFQQRGRKEAYEKEWMVSGQQGMARDRAEAVPTKTRQKLDVKMGTRQR